MRLSKVTHLTVNTNLLFPLLIFFKNISIYFEHVLAALTDL